MARKAVGLRLDEGLLARVDACRGDVSRTRWVERALEGALGDPGALDQEAGGITKAAVSGVVSGSHPGPSSDRASGDPAPVGFDPLFWPGFDPFGLPGIVRGSQLVGEPEPSDDADPFAEDEWPPREARDW